MNYWTLPPRVTVEAVGGGAAGSGTAGPLGLAGTDPAASRRRGRGGPAGSGRWRSRRWPRRRRRSKRSSGRARRDSQHATIVERARRAAATEPDGRASAVEPPARAAEPAVRAPARQPHGAAGRCGDHPRRTRFPASDRGRGCSRSPGERPAARSNPTRLGTGRRRRCAAGRPRCPRPARTRAELAGSRTDLPRSEGARRPAMATRRRDRCGPGDRSTGGADGVGLGDGCSRRGPLTRGAGNRASSPAHPGLYPPMMGMGMGAPDREHRRPDYLLDDGNAFADHRWFPPPVIAADDLPPPPRLH